MSRLIASCPAKVNLGLRVLGRRSDGYHEIVTLFQAIDLRDTLDVEDGGDLTLAVDDPSIPADERNLVLRAARLLQGRIPAAAGRGATLRLRKRIPAGGGLGGGSSDAAGALLALDALWSLGLDPIVLAALAGEIGSDVPFFLTGGTAIGTGRGEVVAPLPPIPERPLILGLPPFPLSTSTVYGALARPLTPPGADVTVTPLFVNFAERNDFALATNDLEATAFAMRGELALFRDALAGLGAEASLLSGSGSTVFGLFDEGTDVAGFIPALSGTFPGWTIRVSRTVASGVALAVAEDEGTVGGSTPARS